MWSVETRSRVSRYCRSHSSMASHRSSVGVRFHCRQRLQTTHSRPRSESNASRRPMGKCSMVSLASSAAWQKMHVEYIPSEYVRRYGHRRGCLLTNQEECHAEDHVHGKQQESLEPGRLTVVRNRVHAERHRGDCDQLDRVLEH